MSKAERLGSDSQSRRSKHQGPRSKYKVSYLKSQDRDLKGRYLKLHDRNLKVQYLNSQDQNLKAQAREFQNLNINIQDQRSKIEI